jgi:hypothetical protein
MYFTCLISVDSTIIFCSNYGVRSEEIGNTHLPNDTGGEEDKFEDALRLLARMIARSLLKEKHDKPGTTNRKGA